MVIILYFLLFISILSGVLIRVSPFPSVNVYLQDLVVLAILFLCGKGIFQYLVTNYKKLWPLVLFSMVGVLGLFINTRSVFEFGSSISYLFRLLCYLAISIPLLKLKKDKLFLLLKGMVVVGFFFVAVGYVQYILYPNLRNLYYLGWDEHLYRLFSTFLDPNFAGIFIVLVLLLYSYFVVNNFSKAWIFKKAAYLGGYVFLSTSLFLTYSRSSYISLLVSSVVFLILLNKKKLVIALCLVFVVGIVLVPKNLGGEGVKLFRTASIFARLTDYQEGVKIFLSSPFIGMGFNSLRFVSERFGFVSSKNALISHSAAGISNSYLFTLATTGIVGFSAVAYFLLHILKGIYRILKENKGQRVYSIVVFTSFIAILTGSLFENTLFFPQILLWLVLLSGILFGITRKKS